MTRTNISLIALTGVALLVAGCGGSSSPGVAHLSAATSSSTDAAGGGTSSPSGAPTQQQMVAFSHCMRSHGVPEFPEPSEGHVLVRRNDKSGRVTGLDPTSARLQAARKVCGKLLPNGGVPSPAQQAKLQEDALKFSQCMRTHGVPSFPDPKFSGNAVQLKVTARAGGIDPRSPQFKAAQKACQSVVPKLPGAKEGPAGGGVAIGVGGPKGE